MDLTLKESWLQGVASHDWKEVENLLPQLLEQDPELLFEKDCLGRTAFERGCRHNIGAARRLLDEMKARKELDPQGFAAAVDRGLRGAAYFHDCPDLARAILGAGAGVNSQDFERGHDTALHVAVRRRHWAYAEALLQAGARADIANVSGEMAGECLDERGAASLALRIKQEQEGAGLGLLSKLAIDWLAARPGEPAQALYSQAGNESAVAEKILKRREAATDLGRLRNKSGPK